MKFGTCIYITSQFDTTDKDLIGSAVVIAICYDDSGMAADMPNYVPAKRFKSMDLARNYACLVRQTNPEDKMACKKLENFKTEI